MDQDKTFLGTEPVGKLLLKLAVPTVIAQLVNMLYNIVDRIYIGHMPGDGSLALTGIGVCMPIILVVSAFASFSATGGAPRASIFMGRGDHDYTANTLQAQLLYLDSVDNGKDISIYINSPGGSVTAGLGIYDTMQFISSDVATICTGMAASMGAVLLVAGTEGKRSALTHSRVMIHQPLGGVQGQASDIEIEAKEIQKFKKELYNIISEHSHTPFEKVWQDSDRNYWMTAEEAREYGMIDTVLKRKK